MLTEFTVEHEMEKQQLGETTGVLSLEPIWCLPNMSMSNFVDCETLLIWDADESDAPFDDIEIFALFSDS